MEETSRRQRRMEASSDGGHGTKGAVVPYREGNRKILRNESTAQFQPFRYQQNDQTQEAETGSICAIHWGMRYIYNILVRKLKGSKQNGTTGVRARSCFTWLKIRSSGGRL